MSTDLPTLFYFSLLPEPHFFFILAQYQYVIFTLTSLRWTILDQLALYTDEGQLIARRCH